LAAILYPEKLVTRATSIFNGARGIRNERDFAPIKCGQVLGQAPVAQIGQIGDRKFALGSARVTANKNKVVRLGPGRVELEVVLDLRRGTVFVDPKDADIEIVSRVLEIIRVTPVKGGLLFRRKHEADIGVNLVAIQVVGTTLVKRDHVTA